MSSDDEVIELPRTADQQRRDRLAGRPVDAPKAKAAPSAPATGAQKKTAVPAPAKASAPPQAPVVGGGAHTGSSSGGAEAAKQKRTATDYDKWNKVKMSDLGWTVDDERRDKITPAMETVLAYKRDHDRIDAIKKQLAAARTDSKAATARLAALHEQHEQGTRKINKIVFGVSAVVIFALLGMAAFVPNSTRGALDPIAEVRGGVPPSMPAAGEIPRAGASRAKKGTHPSRR